MKNRRWLAAFTAMVAILLLGQGIFTVSAIDATRNIEVVPNSPFSSADDVASAKSFLPAMYVVAVEGLVFGVVAIICAIALFTQRAWAPRTVLVASVLLAVVALVSIIMAPHQWDTQGVFMLLCALLWWEARKWRQE
jgi:hypothetical protein